MRVLLIQPPYAKELDKEFMSLQYPLNLGYIASSLQKANHEIRMLDFNVMEKQELETTINKFKPQIVGITALTPSIINAKEIINKVKEIDKNIITILGGLHASALPIQTMEEIESLDFLVFGEGEITIVNLLENLSNPSKVKGVVFRKDKEIIKNPPRELIKNLDDIPFPSRDLIPLELYKKHHVIRGFSRKELNIAELLIGRGCPNQCIFCAGHINYGFSVRFRSFENIKEEVEKCILNYQVEHISIQDDTFTLNKELVKKICEFFKEKNLTWDCNTRVNTVNYELLKLMADSGCRKICFGVETGDPEIMKKNKKGITIDQVIKAVNEAKRAKIKYIECDFMIGSHPDETIESVRNTEKLIFKLMPDFLSLAIICPFPGTEIYEMMIKNKLLLEKPNWEKFSFFGELPRYKRLTYLTSHQLFFLQKSIFKRYYSSPRYILLLLRKIKSYRELKYFSRLGIQFLKEIFFKKDKVIK